VHTSKVHPCARAPKLCQTVLVDDNVDNVEAARALGMETVHFGDDPRVALAELDAILTRRGLA